MSNQQAVIRTVNGEIDDVFIENVDVHLERMDRDEWSLILYRGEKRIRFTIRSEPVLDLWESTEIYIDLNDDTIGCEREEQGE